MVTDKEENICGIHHIMIRNWQTANAPVVLFLSAFISSHPDVYKDRMMAERYAVFNRISNIPEPPRRAYCFPFSLFLFPEKHIRGQKNLSP